MSVQQTEQNKSNSLHVNGLIHLYSCTYIQYNIIYCICYLYYNTYV